MDTGNYPSRRPRFWPDSRKSGIYSRLVIVNVVPAVALLVFSFWLYGFSLLLCVALISSPGRRHAGRDCCPDRPDSSCLS